MAEGINQSTEFFRDFGPATSQRIQDQMMVDWLKGMRYRRQSPTVVPAWMSKQFASKKELHKDQKQKQAMPYPMISLSMGSITPDLSRRVVNDVRTIGGEPLLSDPNDPSSDRIIIPWPMPITIPYTVDIWTKTRQDLRYLETAVLERFSFVNETFLKATFPGYGEISIPLLWDSSDDTSDLETMDAQKDRELRKTISLTLQGWLFRTPKRIKSVHTANVVYIDSSVDLIEDQDFLDHYCDSENNYNFGSDGAITSVTEDPNNPPNRVLLWVSFGEEGQIGTGSQA